MRLPNVLWEGAEVDLNAVLQDTVNYPVVVLQSGIRDVWRELEDFFGDRPVIFPDQMSWKNFARDLVRPAGIYSEKEMPPLVYMHSAHVCIYLSPEGDWSLKKFLPASISDSGVPIPAIQNFPRHRQISTNTPSRRYSGPPPMQQVPRNWLSEDALTQVQALLKNVPIVSQKEPARRSWKN